MLQICMEIKNIFLNSVNSTNDYAKKHMSQFDPSALTCIFAEEQVAGYGSHHRSWISTKNKDILATFYFHLPEKISNLTCLGYLMAFTLCQILISYTLAPMIKWPNDILLSQKKLSGILGETKDNGTNIFLGIGINVNSDVEDLKHIDQPATSLKIETGHLWDIKKLQNELQISFLKNLNIFKTQGFVFFHPLINELLAKKGEEISFLENGEKRIGKIQNITKDGYLKLLLPDGTTKNIYSTNL